MDKFKHKIILMTATMMFFVTSGAAYDAHTSIDGSKFDNIVLNEETQLHLKGVALLKYLKFIKAYTGALYMPEEHDGAEALHDIPRHLVLEYRASISAPDFAKATSLKIKESVENDTYLMLEPQIQQLNQLYRDVKPGDRYSLTYTPGRGTRLNYNSMPLGTIEGAEFSKALFSIWIGENPINVKFRDRLLGNL